MTLLKIIVDGTDAEVAPGQDLLSACLSLGVAVPHFCWHGALGSVGACRLCAVRVHDGPDDAHGRIEMACMMPAADGQRVEVMDPEAAEMMGINSQQIYAIAMGLSLAIVAIAGILLGVRTNFAPTSGPARLLLAFEAVIIGGLGNLWGTLAAGIILGLAQTIGAQINPTYFQLSGHLVTLLVLVFRPTGLFAVTRDT